MFAFIPKKERKKFLFSNHFIYKLKKKDIVKLFLLNKITRKINKNNKKINLKTSL